MNEISSMNSTLEVELSGEREWISSKEDTGKYKGLFSASGEGSCGSDAGEEGEELGNIRCVRTESGEEGDWLTGETNRTGQ